MSKPTIMEHAADRVRETDREVVRSAKEGDQQGFYQLFERYSLPLLSFLFAMVGDRNLAEDLMQESFTRAFALLDHLGEKSNFSTWLFGIAKNVARENARRQKRGPHRIGLEDPAIGELRDPRENPEAQVITQQLCQAINSGFAGLKEERRAALALRVLGENSYHEIAEITGWSLAKVKTEIHRARLQMRKLVGPHL